MEKHLAIAVFVAIAAVCAFLGWRWSRWVRCEATAHTPPDFKRGTGEKIPVSYKLPDGRELTAGYTLYSKNAVPEAGETLFIRYDPQSPNDIIHPATPVGLFVFAAAGLAFAFGIWRS